jgi:hypothetical protein
VHQKPEISPLRLPAKLINEANPTYADGFKNSRPLTLAPFHVQSVKTRSFAASLQSFIAVFHILFH